jgi:hypothetical protein
MLWVGMSAGGPVATDRRAEGDPCGNDFFQDHPHE